MSNTPYAPISLIYAKSTEYNPTSAFCVEGYIGAQLPDGTREVKVHYTFDEISWTCILASYHTYTECSEIWFFKLPASNISSKCTFYLEYISHGFKYLDDNAGKNYCIKWFSPTSILKSCSVVLDKVFTQQGIICGKILVKDIAYHKQVRILCSTDGWVTRNSYEAFYKEKVSDILEKWEFSFYLNQNSPFQLAVQYSVNEETYFDDNFGNYYIFHPEQNS